MKSLLVANFVKENPRYNFQTLLTLLNAQIENSLELGWSKDDFIILANFDYEFMGVLATQIPLNTHCLTGSKMFGVKWLFENTDIDKVWVRDLDVWPNVLFDYPDFNDIGIACYSTPKLNGGSVFWRKKAKDIIDRVVKEIQDNKLDREEPILNKILRQPEYKDRLTIVNYTYNVGCSGFLVRYLNSDKPIKAVHFHPTNRIAWETHVLDRSGLGITISPRLEKLFRKWYPNLATELSDGGKKRRAEKIRRINEKVNRRGD